jgi:outer membrane protein OmpA-like peptidoglycan-associated protein
MRRLLYIIILTACFSANAQVKKDTLRLYYKINETTSDVSNRRLDSFVTALQGHFIKIRIVGYADFLHNNGYNQKLSQRRADEVKEELLAKAAPKQIELLECKGAGEKYSNDNGSKEGEASQRRVDVIFEPVVLVESYNQEPEPEKIKKDTVENKKNIEDLKKGESLAIAGLNFIPGRHIVVKEAVPILEQLLKTLQNNPKLKIEIQGHICCVEDQDDGLDLDTGERNLSVSRARAVYNYLVKNGIDASRLSYKGFGRKKPKVYPERTPEEEQMNRRVEIMVIEK